MKLPRPYISPSQFNLFWKDPEKYYLDYYLVRSDQPTPKMTFGTIFQLAWCDPKYDFDKALMQAGFVHSYARIIRTALTHPHTVRLPKKHTEKTMRGKGLGLLWPVLAIADGVDPKINLVIENKMGMIWTQKMVDENVQLTFQALTFYLKHGFLPNQILQCFNSKHGIPTVFKTKRTMKQLKELVHQVNNMVRLIQAGDFKPKA